MYTTLQAGVEGVVEDDVPLLYFVGADVRLAAKRNVPVVPVPLFNGFQGC